MDEKKLQQEFIQFLSKKLNAKDEQDLRDKVKNLSQDELDKYYEKFTEMKLRAGAHGTKLQYFRQLKHQCAEDEELVYFKKGGSVGCGCVKKAQAGTTVPNKKENTVVKKTVKPNSNKLDPNKTKTLPNGKYPSNWTVEDKTIWERKWGANDEGAAATKNKGIKKNCGGATIKLKKKGGEVCPKCGKIHAAGMGCAAKFKMHRQGGNLNGIPFYQAGTNKGGLPTAQKATERYKGARGIMYGDNKVTIQEIENPNTRAKIELDILGNDSTITETPPHSWYITPKRRISSNRRFSIPPYETIDGNEWNIMKRRWEEAKKVMSKVPYYAGPLYGTYPLPK